MVKKKKLILQVGKMFTMAGVVTFAIHISVQFRMILMLPGLGYEDLTHVRIRASDSRKL